MRSTITLNALMLGFLLTTIAITGCKPPESSQAQAPVKPNTGVFGKKTQEIGEFDPQGDAKIQDYDPGTHNPINPLSSLKQYKSLTAKVSKLGIKKAVDLFQAEHGRYPKDHKEFMSKIIQRNNIHLPVLPGGAQYQYDVDKHELVVIEMPAEEKKK